MIRRFEVLPTVDLHLGLMLALTFSTGVNDAVGYLGLDRVFTGNMTGNVVVLGMAVVGSQNLPVLGPLLALGGFMLGAALGGRVLKGSGPGWTERTTLLFSLVSATMLVVGVGLLRVEDDLTRTIDVCTTTVLGAAMGVQAATARYLAVKDVTTVVVTSTITGLAADSVLGSGKGTGDTPRRVAAVLLILSGAAAGAALLKWHLGCGLLLAATVSTVVTVLGALHARHADVQA